MCRLCKRPSLMCRAKGSESATPSSPVCRPKVLNQPIRHIRCVCRRFRISRIAISGVSAARFETAVHHLQTLLSPPPAPSSDAAAAKSTPLCVTICRGILTPHVKDKGRRTSSPSCHYVDLSLKAFYHLFSREQKLIDYFCVRSIATKRHC